MIIDFFFIELKMNNQISFHFYLILYLIIIICHITINPPYCIGSKISLNILQYNVFGRPDEISFDGQKERFEKIPYEISKISFSLDNKKKHSYNEKMNKIDVITFAEADIASERTEMLNYFKKHGYNYSTSILHDPDPFTSLLNGGVLIVSKWPILRQGQHIYRQACHYSDCLAAKGVKYARILKTNEKNEKKIFNIFATHMQAWSTKEGRLDRIKQAQQMRTFIDNFNLPENEPVLLAGDFNVDNHTFPMEVKNLVSILNASLPNRIGTQMFTSDPHTNVLVGRDGAANNNKCKDAYMNSWKPFENGIYHPNALSRAECNGSDLIMYNKKSENMCFCPCCPYEWIDYILISEKHQKPSSIPFIFSIPLKTLEPFDVLWSTWEINNKKDNIEYQEKKIELYDLSDHYPVIGNFEFEIQSSNNPNPLYYLNGCMTDEDCHFSLSLHCYCTGSGCHYNDRIVNGKDYGPDHAINKNCIFEKTKGKCFCGPM